MECSYSFLAWSTLVLAVCLLVQLLPRKSTGLKPPGPPGWPVFGNMFDLGTLPHQSLYSLIPKYGPVIWLKLGYKNAMVIQSAKAAGELFKKHDLPFCDRMCLDAFTAHDYNQGSLAFGQYGTYWRILRRICSMELLGNKRINETAMIRQKYIHEMIQSIEDCATASDEVDIPHVLFTMVVNLVGNLMLSRNVVDSQSKQGREFCDALSKFMVWAGIPNVADFLPFLKWLDPQGIKRNMLHDAGRALNIVDGFVKERIQEHKLGNVNANKDFLSALMEYEGNGKEGPDRISNKNMSVIVLEMFVASAETISSTIEWGMTELLRSPEIMRKAKDELERVVGLHRKVKESDINQLPFLQAIVKETLRLHPVGPLLIPRNALEDTNYMGYLIPKGTMIQVNLWAIGRDPDVWEDPLSFKPERFLGSNIDYKGNNFELISFGSGRRICVGISLAHHVVHLGLASLLHSFDWELGNNSSPEAIDMTEKMGLTLRKLVPLKAIAKKRMLY